MICLSSGWIVERLGVGKLLALSSLLTAGGLIGYALAPSWAVMVVLGLVAEAQAAINAQKMAALTEVKNQIGKLVIEVSEKVLRKELGNKDAQEAHIKGLVDEVKMN